jgi:ketosteroid isomerase-like protein
MTIEATQAEIRHIYEQWHESVKSRDLDALMALYAEEAIFESPLTLATLPENQSGILTGKTAIASFFAAGLRHLTTWAAGTAPAPSSATAHNSRGSIRGRLRTAIRSIWSR